MTRRGRRTTLDVRKAAGVARLWQADSKLAHVVKPK
jgi:hypothetical protein